MEPLLVRMLAATDLELPGLNLVVPGTAESLEC